MLKNNVSQNKGGPDLPSPIRQPMSAFTQTPLPPFSANVSICPATPPFCVTFVSIFNATLSLNDNFFLGKNCIRPKLSIFEDEFHKKYVFSLLSVMSTLAKKPTLPLCQPKSAFTWPPISPSSANVSISKPQKVNYDNCFPGEPIAIPLCLLWALITNNFPMIATYRSEAWYHCHITLNEIYNAYIYGK